ncbi:porin [Pantoea sp. Pa-EAmG]|uniref:porin n=1 Tax=Pantoea sp. Pa-EAmG TaxID=3043311 RepID=UPI0024AFDA9B|nr:porin [Pantoea sp. Pa-EAmG]MDI6958116.1 porin [Pantoea sp. Pa-EAmG]
MSESLFSARPFIALMWTGLFSFSNLVAAAPLSHTSEHSLDFYGTLVARRFMSHKPADDGDRTYLYFGLKGTRWLSPDWQAYGQWEYTVSAADASRNATRLAFLGIKNRKLGRLDIGRNWGVLYDVTSLTDRSPLFREMSYNYVDNVMRGRAEDLLTYRQSFDVIRTPVHVALQYQFPGHQTDRPVTKCYGKGLGASLEASFTSRFSAIVAASTSSATRIQQHKAGYQKQIRTLSGGLRYQSPKWYLAAVSTRSNNAIHPEPAANAHPAFSEEVLMKVMLTPSLQPHVGYTRLRQTESGYRRDVLNYDEVGLTWYLGKNMQVFIDYKLNNLRQHHHQTDAADKAEIGLSYHW